ncbi:uncharacterized protein B0H18DRAFT_957739 [Fomitopsis serialis]|uniref:uncharacterized protein n=1 Tax=Fomitopsis serialis TaxID=139415 RepID=UPI0020082DF0|nr:uncharacterized protein B0H18DRAFT_957739 [Neoantrodia serialis]KAH9918978.1 hypothetical protein B0H18DRAFT_957739 [Neoantrodia serialis]
MSTEVGVFFCILNFIHGQAILVIASGGAILDQFLTYSRYYKLSSCMEITIWGRLQNSHFEGEKGCNHVHRGICGRKGLLHQSEQPGVVRTDAPPNSIWALICVYVQEKASG